MNNMMPPHCRSRITGILESWFDQLGAIERHGAPVCSVDAMLPPAGAGNVRVVDPDDLGATVTADGDHRRCQAWAQPVPRRELTLAIRLPGTIRLGQTIQWPFDRARITVERM
jgi:hypothetical protein